MTAPSPIAKVSVGKSGYGSAHAAYITRLSALDPEGRESGIRGERRAEQLSLFASDENGTREPTARETLEDNLSEGSLAGGKEHGGEEQDRADPIWTWNAPEFLTSGDRERLTLKDKVQNIKDYFGSLEDYERRKGGRTHYRIILSFDVSASNEQIRDLTNRFLEQAFPKAIAFGEIHRDTEHPHVHLYLNSRQV